MDRLSNHFEKSITEDLRFPPTYRGNCLKEIAFPLGGIGTGSVSLGGRGQLRDWEIFNKADKGNDLSYCFPAIRVKAPDSAPRAKVLEGRILPPYQGATGLGYQSLAGLPRFSSNTFSGAYPFAYLTFTDETLPVRVTLEAFNPLIPLETDDSGLPAAVLRYRVENTCREKLEVSLALSLTNPVGDEGAVNESRDLEEIDVSSIYMHNPSLKANHPLKGSVSFGVDDPHATYLAGWKGRAKGASRSWWDKPQSFWETFKEKGYLSNVERVEREDSTVAMDGSLPASLCSKFDLSPGESAARTFAITWRFPNRTPARCGWSAPQGREEEIIGNHYAERFSDSQTVLEELVENLDELEEESKSFVTSVTESSLPSAVKEAALSNLSTLCTNTCFREADGAFHGFEGTHDCKGCCFGDCTHVWNYEVATAFLFPELARSLRETEFLNDTDKEGRMSFRTLLPKGGERTGEAAADGQMGCLVKLYRDWKLSGDTDWALSLWPMAKKALSFAWIEGGWDADEDGVMEGVQHETYDVEFYGPNPQCQLWYLAALKAGERLARAAGDEEFAAKCRRLYELGSSWTDENLFNGEYYFQEIKGHEGEIAEGLQVGMGAADPEAPDFQLGKGCLVDGLVGQFMSHLSGLGYLLDEENVKSASKAIFQNNYRESLAEHECTQRTFALNGEAGLVICSYPRGDRPEVPFPYFAELMTGFEYSAAVEMIYDGFLEEGLRAIEAIRDRYDGERRNPWDEAECGHHYARAMASWGAIVALSGFQYDMIEGKMSFSPRMEEEDFKTFWSTGSAWGTLHRYEEEGRMKADLRVLHGDLDGVEVSVLGVEEEDLSVEVK